MTELQARLQDVLGMSYRIERELGGGGMSRVFLAEEVDLARKVVVKVLPPDMAAGLNAERFKREIQLAASLQHPHIVPLIASGRTGDVVWYTMPFIEGESLRAKLARERELPVGDAVRILRDVCDALSYAHEHGVVHRDIKPDNVLITGRHAVVTDFGVAKAVSASTGESSLTSIGVALGTPAYMAPEQASADPHVDHRADIYSVGAMAYEMLSGTTPFSGPPQLVLAAHVTQSPEPVSQRRPSIPPALATLVMRSLEKKAADRWQSANELHQQLELMATPSGGAPPTSATVATPAHPVLRRPLRLGAAVAVVAAIAAAVSWAALKPGSGVDTVALDPRVVAVLPFRVAGADPSLHYLRQGMLDLLQAKLTGEGGPRAADARSVLAAFRDAGGTDESDVADAGLQVIAAKLGAGRVLQGSIVGPPEHVVLNATLIEIPGLKTVAQTSVEGPKDSLFAMVDRLAAQVLALGAGATAQQLSALTTTNMDALRAYLDGVTAYRRGAFSRATALLTRAVELDTTFALASSALVESHGWVGGTIPISRVRRLAWQYRDRLNPRDRRILGLRVGARYPATTPYTEQIRDRELATQEMPDSPEVWYYLGDVLFHYGRLADVRDNLAQSEVAFQRAFHLDSLYGAPVTHLMSVAGVAGDTASYEWRRRMATLDTTNIQSRNSADWVVATMKGDSRELNRLLDAADTNVLWNGRLQQFYAWDSAVVVNQNRISDSELRLSTNTDRRTQAMLNRINALWNLGRPAETRSWRDSAQRLTPDLQTIPYMMFGWLAADQAPGPVPPVRKEDPPLIIWFAEILRLREGDASSASKTAGALRADTLRDPGAIRMALILEAMATQVTGAPQATTGRLLSSADSAVRGWDENNETSSRLLSDLWEKSGHPDRALIALRRRTHPLGNPSMLGIAAMLRREGRLSAQLGDTASAIRAYERYLVMRYNPEPVLIPQRDSVVGELAALKPRR